MPRLDEFKAGLAELFDDIGEPITVNGEELTAIVSLDTEAIGDEGVVDVDGTMKLKASDYTEHFEPESGPVLEFEWQGQTFHVLPSPITQHGITTCRIRRHSQHQKRAGYMGLNEEQAIY